MVDAMECLNTVIPFLLGDTNIYKLLSNDGTTENIKLSDQDKTIMTVLLDENFNIPAIETVQENDEVGIIDERLADVQGRIKKDNRRRQTATIENLMFGRSIEIEIMLENVIKPQK